jgi:membrane protease YdiL (CAAX protease family)
MMIDQTQNVFPIDKRGIHSTEAAVVLVATIGALGGVHYTGLTSWWIAPAILIAAGVLPYLARRQSPAAMLRVETLGLDARLVLYTCLAVFPLTFVALRILHGLDLSLPFSHTRPTNYAAWVIYQFLYVAVAEEIFFRGYLLTRLRKVFTGTWTAVAASAGGFALAHVVLQGQASGGVTFLPGLVLGWLYIRTGTLLAPILFHGLANVFWQIAMGVL